MTLAAAALAIGALIAGAGTVRADTIFEVEHARANARAGGPVSEFDAELLERYGALSGTPDWRPKRARSYDHGDQGPPRKARRKRPAANVD